MKTARLRPTGLKYNIKKINPSWFKPGVSSWNTGTVGVMKINKTSFKKGSNISPDTQFKNGDTTGTKNTKWKGNAVGYSGLHSWVVRTLGKASKCSNPNCKKMSKRYEWSSISNKYLRDIKDWQELCHKCHAAYDKQYVGHIIKKYGEKHNVY